MHHLKIILHNAIFLCILHAVFLDKNNHGRLFSNIAQYLPDRDNRAVVPFDNVQYCKGVTVVSEVLVLAEVEINVNRSIWLII